MVAIIVLVQKVLPTNPAIDVPLAIAIAALGVVIVLAPAIVPGLATPM